MRLGFRRYGQSVDSTGFHFITYCCRSHHFVFVVTCYERVGPEHILIWLILRVKYKARKETEILLLLKSFKWGNWVVI